MPSFPKDLQKSAGKEDNAGYHPEILCCHNREQHIFTSLNRTLACRAKVQSSIKEGLIFVNGRSCMKPGQRLRTGDKVAVTGLVRPPPTLAAPEDIPLDIAFEDEHLMVINKPAGMVVHPAPGNYSG